MTKFFRAISLILCSSAALCSMAKDQTINTATMHLLTAAHNNNTAGVIAALAENNVQINQGNAEQETALHLAAQHGNIKMVTDLLDHGADVNVTNSMTQGTPLFGATTLEVAQLLIDRGADIKHQALFNLTPLHLTFDKPAIAGLLLEHGADINAQTVFGWTPLYLAVSTNNASGIAFLLEHGARTDLKDTLMGGLTVYELAKKRESYDRNKSA